MLYGLLTVQYYRGYGKKIVTHERYACAQLDWLPSFFIKLVPLTLFIDRILGRILSLSETMSEQTFTTLQPVILGNDEYDEMSRKEVFTFNCDETFLKEVYSPELPNDLFLSKLLSDYHSDEMELKEFRNTMFVELKALEEFPFPPGSELNRRKKPGMGESAAIILCSDIYVLTSVLDGAPFEYMKELISVSKYYQET